MANPRKILRQWLETDAALGVTEVPLPRRPKSAAQNKGDRTHSPHPTPSATHFAARPTPPARPLAAAPPRNSELRTQNSEPVPTITSEFGIRISEFPPISSLPPLTRAQKDALFAQWLADLQAASQPYINELATRIVPGEGDLDSPLLFIGEGPGTEEDRLGRPFVGRSGQLLDKMINAMGFKREQIYIANIVKLRSADWDQAAGRPKDRPPTPEEAARGLPFLHRQIEIIRPKVIVTLGAPAIKHLTGETEGVMKIRGHWRDFRGIPVMPTYHPAFVLRAYSEENRGKVWSDLKQVMKLLGLPAK